MRDTLFRKLFIGPLPPRIDPPASLGKSQLVGPDYPYPVCAAYPYADNINNKTYIAIILALILSGILN